MNSKLKILAAAVAVSISFASQTSVASGEIKIEDPYKDDQSQSPWSMSLRDVTTFGGRVIRGDATLLSGKDYKGFDAYTPFMMDKTEVINGYGSTNVGVGCDGINLGGVIDGQMDQYGKMVESFIQNAPALAIMYLAYSQPVVKAVIDEMNTVGQFGLDLSNMTCSGVRAIADKSAEEKAQAMAEARCTARAGFKDPDCMADEGVLRNVSQVMKGTKQVTNERAGAFLGKVSDGSGGLVRFRAGVDGNAVTSSGTSGGTSSSGPREAAVTRTEACTDVRTEGLRTLLLGASGLPCADILSYGELLPDYQISDEGISGVVPRKLTIRKVATEMVVTYEGWLGSIFELPEAEYIHSEGFKAIFNRTGISITVNQHRAINRMMTTKPAQGVSMIRNLSQMIALKDLTSVVNRLEVAVLTGIQNQPDQELLPELRKKQYLHAIDMLKTELRTLTDEVNMDLMKNEIVSAR